VCIAETALKWKPGETLCREWTSYRL